MRSDDSFNTEPDVSSKGTGPSGDANPWRDQHIEAEAIYQDNDRAMAEAIVANEYRNAPSSFPCLRCTGTAFYKATIGAMKCSGCGALYHTNGELI